MSKVLQWYLLKGRSRAKSCKYAKVNTKTICANGLCKNRYKSRLHKDKYKDSLYKNRCKKGTIIEKSVEDNRWEKN